MNGNLKPEREFRAKQVDDTFVVWLEKANRFLQLKEPAFFVFDQWARSKPLPEIAASCSVRYDLPETEAKRFVNEIIEGIKLLYRKQSDIKNESPDHRKDARLNDKVGQAKTQSNISPYYSEINCRIFNKALCFLYGSKELEDLFRPPFKQFEVPVLAAGVKKLNAFKFFKTKGNYCFRVNGSEAQKFDPEDLEHYQGAVLLEFLNILHDKTKEDWMGVFHASAVSSGGNALLFIGEPGAGKSTLAALMVANGCKLVSDDFVPVSMDHGEVYPLPSAISVKKGSLTLLGQSFPELNKIQEEGEAEYKEFLPLSEEKLEGSPVKAKALVFVKYDPDRPFRLVKESNLDMMNRLLKQSWIPGNSQTAACFLEWYFSLPVYSLVYSITAEVIKGLKVIFGDNKQSV